MSVSADAVGSKCLSTVPLPCDGRRLTTVRDAVPLLEESKPSRVNQNEVKYVCGQAPCDRKVSLSKNVSVFVTNVAVSTVFEDIK